MPPNISLHNFTQLTTKELDLILEWRNNPNIRKWMLQKEIISNDSHYAFIHFLKKSQEKEYYLVKEDKEYIGVIDFTKITNAAAAIGLYKNPDLKNKGNILMRSIIEYAFNTLHLTRIQAEVYKDNKTAHSLYKKHLFKEIQHTNTMIYLELKNENR